MAVRLKEWLARGRLARVFCLGQLCDPKWVEILAQHGGWEAVWLDQEHGGLTISQIEQATRAARACGLDSFVRLAPTDYATVMRPLEAGAGGIMAAQVRSAAQVEEIVRWAKFHPRGVRGVNSTGIDGGYGRLPMADYLRRANADSLIAVQIEHADAVREVEQIAAVPDVDLLFIGPADLSQSMGIPGQWERPELWDAFERVARAAHDRGIAWGILPMNPDVARRCVALGCRLLSLGLDVWAVHKGLEAFRQEYAEWTGPAGAQ